MSGSRSRSRLQIGATAVVFALGLCPVRSSEAVELRPGDIVFAVFDGYGGECLGGCGGVVKVDPVTGEHTPISVGGIFRDPIGVALDPATGDLIVRDIGHPSNLVRVKPETGEQIMLPTLNQSFCGAGGRCGIAVDRQGRVYLGGPPDLAAWYLASGEIIRGLTGQYFALEPMGTVVTNFAASIWRSGAWNPYEMELVASNGYLAGAGVRAIAVDPDGKIIVMANLTYLIEIDSVTGEQRILKSGLPPMLDNGLAAEANGDILYTMGNPTHLYRLHRATGESTYISTITTEQNMVGIRTGSFFVYPRIPCNDSIDNDGDGLIDAGADLGCQNRVTLREDPACQDGIDNDGDGKFDFDGGASANGDIALGEPDPQCGAPWKSNEGASCGIGVELVGVLLLMRAARRRRQGNSPRGLGTEREKHSL